MQIAVQTSNSIVRSVGGIRSFVESDLPAVAELYAKVFPQGRQYSQERLQARFSRILLQNPWYDPSIPSLVYEQEGRIVGFLGIVVRPMMLGNVALRVAVGNHFMVDPDSRSTKAGLSLLSKLFAGPQDLAIAESGDASRKIWEALGGRTSLGYSLYWTRLLRPARYGLYQLRRKGLPRPLGWLSRPFCNLADALAARVKPSPLYQQPQPAEEELSEKELLECLARFPKPSALRPSYDEYSLNWLLTVLAEKRVLGRLRKVVVRGERNEIVGWYVYYLNAGGVSTVAQIWASPGDLGDILGHLCYHAWRGGSIALTGRLQPRFTKEYGANQCFIHWRSWMLVHSRDPKIRDAVDHQDAFFTSLEGESWISVEGELPDSSLRK
jgi:hypothetical protein